MLNTMTLSQEKMTIYTDILHQELQTAMGCTEPIALAYAAAYAKKVLGRMPTHCVARCSGNIIKNVKAVTVPATGGLKGIEAATLAGICGGDPDGKLYLLMEFAGRPEAEVADPWYTGDFETTWQDVLAGCQGLLDSLQT